jgi:Asp/Glu/hydantoin racemase
LAKAFNLPVIDAVLSAINWAEELAKQHGQT